MVKNATENPAVMDDGHSARDINAGCINAGAAFNCNLKFGIRNVELVSVARQLTKLFSRF